MSIISVIDPPHKTVIAVGVGATGTYGDVWLSVDATVREGYSQSARITDLNIEDGSVVNDHIIMSPPELEIEGIISDTPVDLNPNPFAAFASGVDSLFSDDASTVIPAKNAYEFFRDKMAAKSAFNITTARDYYIDYYITSLRMPLSERTGRAMEFNIRMKKVTVIDLQGGESGVADDKPADDAETDAVEDKEP